jgi:hypothetical protein
MFLAEAVARLRAEGRLQVLARAVVLQASGLAARAMVAALRGEVAEAASAAEQAERIAVPAGAPAPEPGSPD